MPGRPAFAAPATPIRAGTSTIEVKGRAAKAYGLTQPDGRHGLVADAGNPLRVRFENGLDEETLIHWHVVAINGKRLRGAVRDTVLVPSQGRVTVAFDAVNPGKWALHCHHGAPTYGY